MSGVSGIGNMVQAFLLFIGRSIIFMQKAMRVIPF